MIDLQDRTGISGKMMEEALEILSLLVKLSQYLYQALKDRWIDALRNSSTYLPMCICFQSE